MLKSFAQAIGPLFESLSGAQSDLLAMIRENCRSEAIEPTLSTLR